MTNESKKQKAAPVGKADLAVSLGWTRPRLDRRLEQDPKFPVRKRGTRAGGWEFDVAAVLAYLGHGEPTAAPAPRARSAGNAATTKPGKRTPGSAGTEGARGQQAAAGAPEPPEDGSAGGAAAGVEHRGEATAAQRLKHAQAALHEDKLRLARRELVEAEEMRMVLGTMLAHLGKGLDGLPDAITRRMDLPEDGRPVLQEMVDDLRRGMVTDLQALLG